MQQKQPRPAASYAALYPHLCDAVKPLGYALAIHGSMVSDMDLVAIPWVDDAAPPEDVVKTITDRISGFTGWDNDPGKNLPHGRRGWLIWFNDVKLPFGGRCHIDLSIMPRRKKLQYEPETPDEWIKPVMKGYRVQCCDCGLIHELDFQVVEVLERKEDGDLLLTAAGPEYEVEFMARRIDEDD